MLMDPRMGGDIVERTWLKRSGLFPLLIIIALIGACTTTKPTLEWRDQNYAGGSFDNILIVGVADQETVRRSFENTFVEQLGKENTKATASFAVMPPDARPTEENIRSTIAEIKFDSVLFTHLVGVEEEDVYHPPSYSTHPYRGMYGYHGYVRGYVYEPGYYTRHQTVRLETILYDTETEQIVWSMQSETLNPNSEKALIDAKIKAVIQRLKSQGLIGGGL
jgi:hypothetical protein